MEIVVGALGGRLEQLLAHTVFVLLKGVELRDILSELVVELGELRLAHGVDLHLEGGVLSGELLAVALGEGDVDLAVLFGLHANELVLKSGDKHAGADLKAVVLGLSAVEGLAVDEALEIEHDGVALLHRAVHVHVAGAVLALALDLGVNVLVAYGGLGVGRLKAAVLAEGDLGINLGGEGDGQAPVLSGAEVSDGGGAHGLELRFLDSLLECVRRKYLHCFLVEDVVAVHSLYHRARRLALAEAGDIYLALQALICAVYGVLKGVLVYLDLENRRAVFFLFNILDCHGAQTPSMLIGYISSAGIIADYPRKSNAVFAFLGRIQAIILTGRKSTASAETSRSSVTPSRPSKAEAIPLPCMWP